jgi:tetratricopeptide (TPR) repeat protein
MNQRFPRPAPNPGKATIQWRGRTLTVAEAGVAAAQEQRLGNLQAAVDIFDLLLAKLPHSAEVYNNHGAILQMMNRPEEAFVSYDKAATLKPDYANAWFNRGNALKQLNRHDEALASYDKAIALNAAHAEAHNNRGALLQQMRRFDEALTSYDQAITAKPDHAAAHNNRGTALMSKGDLAGAEKMFRRALQLKPDFADPLHSLAKMHRYQDASEPGVKEILALLQKPDILPEKKEHLLFTLGKIYDDCGLYDAAFDYFRQANEIRNATVSYNASAITKLTDGIIEVFNPKFLSKRFAFASESKAPLFIVGMPRSGTTLLASILSNHPAIATAGELPDMADYAMRLGDLLKSGTSYPQAATQLTPAVASHIIKEYVKRLKRDATAGAVHVIDKNPLNFRHLGFIAMLFPQARIIHCTRDLLDTGLSNYFTRFPLSLDYAFDLGNIGHFSREYARLMEHWRKVPAIRMLDISYEDLILQTEPSARRLLDFLGLEWDARCLAPHTNPNPVETASDWQVRQPVYQQSLERWRHYEKHLGPLKEALTAAS